MNTNQELRLASGKVPAEDPELFAKIVGAVIKQWDIREPVDVMAANRMVSCWMKMRYCEDVIKRYGMFFETEDQKGKLVGLKVNEMAYYLKQLEADFRSYYRLLNSTSPDEDKELPNFLDLISEKPKKKKKEDGAGPTEAQN